MFDPVIDKRNASKSSSMYVGPTTVAPSQIAPSRNSMKRG